MANQAHYGQGNTPYLSLQSDTHPMNLGPLGLDQSHLMSPPEAQQQEQYYTQEQAHFPPGSQPPGISPRPGPGFLNHALYVLQQPYQHPPPPWMLPPHQHYGNTPPSASLPPKPQLMSQHPMYSEMMRNNLPPQQPQPPVSWARPVFVAADPFPQKKTISTMGQTKIDKQNTGTLRYDSLPSVSYGQPSNMYYNGFINYVGATLGGSIPERKFIIELEKAKEAMAVMFPRLSERIRSTVLCLLVNDILGPRGKKNKSFSFFPLKIPNWMNPLLLLPFFLVCCRD